MKDFFQKLHRRERIFHIQIKKNLFTNYFSFIQKMIKFQCSLILAIDGKCKNYFQRTEKNVSNFWYKKVFFHVSNNFRNLYWNFKASILRKLFKSMTNANIYPLFGNEKNSQSLLIGCKCKQNLLIFLFSKMIKFEILS